MIAVVVPTRRTPRALFARAARLAAHPEVGEVILVRPEPPADGPEDLRARRGRAAPRGARVRLIEAPLGRAAQMNAGARAATTTHLLFLHGDTVLEAGALAVLARAFARDPDGAFAFALDFDSSRRGYRLLRALAERRDRRSPRPLGDQGLALSRRMFLAMGGFEDLPLFEDLRFVRRLRRRRRLEVLGAHAITSPARFERKGIVRTLAANAGLLALHDAGIAPERLARLYYGAAYVDTWRAARAARA